MKRRAGFVLTTAALCAALGAGTGCNQNTLTGSTANLIVNYTQNPAGAGRFERGSFTVNKILALPADPQAASVFGNERLLFFFGTFNADLTLSQSVQMSHIALSPGTYQVTYFEFTPPALVDTNVPANPPSCIEGIAAIDSGPTFVPDIIKFTNPPTMTFTVHPGQTTLSMNINVPALVNGYEASFTCAQGCGPGGGPCVTAFDEANFRAVFLANVTFQ